jgi:hypothetical protein
MLKRIVKTDSNVSLLTDYRWLNLEHLASVEISSEEAEHPIESALMLGERHGWRAAETGKHTIRLLFNQLVALRRICLLFQENSCQRTQEFVLRWSKDAVEPWREIVRQQYTFAPPGSTQEIEDYAVNLNGVKLLELTIIPDISGGGACASLQAMRLA